MDPQVRVKVRMRVRIRIRVRVRVRISVIIITNPNFNPVLNPIIDGQDDDHHIPSFNLDDLKKNKISHSMSHQECPGGALDPPSHESSKTPRGTLPNPNSNPNCKITQNTEEPPLPPL
jgi:hypothetical protein